jgi:hypothetical protein
LRGNVALVANLWNVPGFGISEALQKQHFLVFDGRDEVSQLAGRQLCVGGMIMKAFA